MSDTQWAHYIEWISIGCHLDKVIYPMVENSDEPINNIVYDLCSYLIHSRRSMISCNDCLDS